MPWLKAVFNAAFGGGAARNEEEIAGQGEKSTRSVIPMDSGIRRISGLNCGTSLKLAR